MEWWKKKKVARCVWGLLLTRDQPPQLLFFLFFDYIEPQKSFPFISARTNEQRESARSICALYEQGWLLYKKKGAESKREKKARRTNVRKIKAIHNFLPLSRVPRRRKKNTVSMYSKYSARRCNTWNRRSSCMEGGGGWWTPTTP